MNDSLTTNAFAAAETPLPIPASERLIGGRFRVVRLLKRERATEYFLAEDTRGESVVVSSRNWTELPAGTRQRIERELKIIGDLRCPELAGVLESGRDGDNFYIARPLVPGITLRRRLRKGPLNLQETLVVGQSLFAALVALHSHDVLHHDIRPATLIVTESSPLRRAVLTDFSVNCCFRPDELPVEELLEAAVYRSPEYAGSLKYDVAKTSDLYSAGIVLFECLAGRPPFLGDDVGDTLLQHMTARVPELRNLAGHIPRAMDELVQRLLHKDPRDRYQSAEAVLIDLNSIVEAADRGAAEPSCVVGCHDRRTTLTEPAFVGRQKELDQLERQIRRAAGGESGIVIVEAESGGGKSRLVAEIAQRGLQAGMWILRGQGSQQVGRQPYRLLSGVVDSLIAEAEASPGFAEKLYEGLGDHVNAVADALPKLAESLGWKTSKVIGPAAFAETRSIQALGALIDFLGTYERPVLMILDDCQWADEVTLKVLAHWQANQAATNRSRSAIMLVVAYRSEEAANGHILRRLDSWLHVTLAPFTAEEVRRLIESMAGPLPAEAVDVVSRLSDGSPFMASAVLRGMVESGALVAEATGWRIEPHALADLRSSSQAAGFLSRRLELLPRDAIHLMTVGAMMGKEFDLKLAAKIAGIPPDRAEGVLEEARARHFIWSQTESTKCTFVHDKISEALLARLEPAQRRELHRDIARLLQVEAPDRVFDLAYHFDAGGETAKALPYALAAAEQSRAQHALEIAEQQYRIAQRAESIVDKATWYTIMLGLGEVLMLRGRYNEARKALSAATLAARGNYAIAQITGQLGELDFKQDQMASAASAYEEALRLLGKPVPRKAVTIALSLLWQAVVQTAHTLFPTFLVGRRKKSPSKTELLRIQLINRLSYVYWFARGKAQTFMVHLLCMNLAERYAPVRSWPTSIPRTRWP